MTVPTNLEPQIPTRVLRLAQYPTTPGLKSRKTTRKAKNNLHQSELETPNSRAIDPKSAAGLSEAAPGAGREAFAIVRRKAAPKIKAPGFRASGFEGFEELGG